MSTDFRARPAASAIELDPDQFDSVVGELHLVRDVGANHVFEEHTQGWQTGVLCLDPLC